MSVLGMSAPSKLATVKVSLWDSMANFPDRIRSGTIPIRHKSRQSQVDILLG